MSNATAQATHAVRSAVIDDRRICTLSSYDADLSRGDCYRARLTITVERPS